MRRLREKLIRKSVSKATGIDSDSSLLKGPDDTQGDEEEQSTSSKETFSKLKQIIRKKGKKKHKSHKSNRKEKSDDDSETDLDSELEKTSRTATSAESTAPSDANTTDGENSDGSDSDGIGHKIPKRKKMPLRTFENTDTSGIYHLMVRIIEGKDLDGTNLRVRAMCDGRIESTRVSSEAHPRWKQNLTFSMDKSLEKLADIILSIKLYTERRIIRDTLNGEWECFLGSIIQQPEKTVHSKWIALRKPAEDQEHNSENVGFLKVSLSIYSNNETPPPLNDEESEELFCGAQLLQYTLRIRVFRLRQLISEIYSPFGQKKKKKQKEVTYSLKVLVGDESIDSSDRPVDPNQERIAFDQELILPIMWPTVINKIIFYMTIHQGKKSQIIATSSIQLNDIYEPGEKGFLPTFGPSFINFYGPEEIPKLQRKPKIKKMMEDTRYYCRLLLSIDCLDSPCDAPQHNRLAHAALKFSQKFDANLYKYMLCGTFFTCNNIDHSFSQKNISFICTIGDYGNIDQKDVHCRGSTLGTEPYYDDKKYFTLPWGNYKPLVSIACVFDNVAYRIERSNAIKKVVNLLSELIDRARVVGEATSGEVASIVVEAIEECLIMLDRLILHHKPDEMCTLLDYKKQEARKSAIIEMNEELESFKKEKFDVDEWSDKGIRFLVRIKDRVTHLANDESSSLPHVMIKMYADGRLVGFAKIPAAKIYYAKNEALRGETCMKNHAIPVDWIGVGKKKKKKSEDVAAQLHMKMWLGNREKERFWKESLEPAQQKAFFEIFHNQTKTALLDDWKDSSKYPPYSDESGRHNLGKFITHPPNSWKFRGSWMLMNPHDIWMKASSGRNIYVDKLFEVEVKIGGEWKFDMYTDYYGTELKRNILEEPPPKDWVVEKDWQPDMHAYGDKNGYSYSISNVFWGEAETVDQQERRAHTYRRRCLQRIRRTKDYNVEHETLEAYEKTLDPDVQWEYGTSIRSGTHQAKSAGDTLRRRRFIIEMKRDEPKPTFKNFYLPRMFEVHDTVSKWEMRAYIIWAKELLPVTKFSSRAFVRVTFMNFCKQTMLVENTQNPIWNESLIFQQLMIPGGQFNISQYPPSVLVEVKGERMDDSELFLGRFTARPTVICSPPDRRCQLNWHILHFRGNKTRGAVLAHFELFQIDEKGNPLPPLPAIKDRTEKYEVPKEIRPKFEHYSVQVLCWGVRNLSKYQLLSVRRPFVEIIVADAEAHTDPLEDINKNPNFTEPFISFDDVLLPEQLDLAPPLMLNLYDRRAFQRTPMIGAASISNISKYTRAIPQKVDSRRDISYKEFDQFVEEEDAHHGPTVPMSGLEAKEGKEDLRIDWWSRYYTSIGEPEKAPGFEDSGLVGFAVYDSSLEDIPEYKRFEDFLDTFNFRKGAKGHFDDAEEKEIKGEMKGKLFITKHVDGKPRLLTHPPGVEFSGPVKCLLRVYIVGAKNLVSPRSSGICDPYIVARIGKQKVNLKKSYCADTTEPDFGELIELTVTIPIEKDLTVSIMDRRKIIADEEVGSTTIDLENRLLTKYRATIGVAREYIVKGPFDWRDQMTPLNILRRYCKKMLLPPPVAIRDENTKEVLGLKVLGMPFLIKDLPAPKKSEITGRPIQRVALYILHKIGLVPEHVESRILYNKVHGTSACGRLNMFVDIFPMSLGSIPPAMNIRCRQPEPFQLRVALFNVTNTILTKRSFGEPSGDIYFKVILNGMKKPQKTDIHYRITDGHGSYNWRFIINFDYNPWEKKLYKYEKKRLFRKARMELVEPCLVIQMWDNNKFKKDGFVGEYIINILDVMEAMMDEEDIKDVYYARQRKTCLCWVGCKFLCKAMCIVCCGCGRSKDTKKKQTPLPRAPKYNPPTRDENEVRLSLFDVMAVRGIWPMLSNWLPNEQKDFDAKKKKDDDAKETDEYVMGCVEMELAIVTAEDAKKDPVGKKRSKPNHSPFLPKPERSRWNAFWFTSRCKPCVKWAWSKCGAQTVCIIIFVLILVLMIVALIYKWPDIVIGIFRPW